MYIQYSNIEIYFYSEILLLIVVRAGLASAMASVVTI